MKEYLIDKKSEGKTIFRFLKTILPGLKNSNIFKLIRKKIIKVNESKTDKDYILSENDSVKIFLADVHFHQKGRKKKFASVKTDLDIIYEDINLLVINKPAGLLCHPDNENFKNNLYEITRAYLYNRGEYNPEDIFTPSPCHRLDRNTSGVFLIAKNQATLKNITGKFRNREVIKKYSALVYGELKTRILITSIIDTDKNENKVMVENLKIYTEIPDKKDFFKNNKDLSATLITPIKYSSNYSLIEVELWTGKKHQIRAHLTAIKHPLLGDKKYFSGESSSLSKKLKIDFFYLHATEIKIDENNYWQAEIPSKLKKIIENLF